MCYNTSASVAAPLVGGKDRWARRPNNPSRIPALWHDRRLLRGPAIADSSQERLRRSEYFAPRPTLGPNDSVGLVGEGGPLGRSNDGAARAVPGAKQDRSPLPPPGGGGDT